MTYRSGRKPVAHAGAWLGWEDQALREGIAKGWSAGHVASALRRTKNSVIGRAWRLGLRFDGAEYWRRAA